VIENKLKIHGKEFNSRLILGTGKYKNLSEMELCIQTSQCEIVTVAIRRLEFKEFNKNSNIISAINWKKIWLLPNTAGAKTAEEAIQLACLGRELTKRIGQEDNNFIKLEVISDPKYLLPDPIGTIKAAEFLIKKGFSVLPYINSFRRSWLCYCYAPWISDWFRSRLTKQNESSNYC
jgi:thiazole synthase